MKRYIYLISPQNISNSKFYNDLNKILKTKKIKYFQLRLKKKSNSVLIKIAKKIIKITNKNKVKLLINDKPIVAKMVNADGCHIGQKDISFIKSSIEDISLDSNSIDIATIAFGFRNFTDHKKALENIYDVLKPGGKLVIMEFTIPKDKIMGKIFETYTDRIIPKLGEFIAKDYDSYKYLAESIKTYYSPNQVLKMFEENKYINNKFIFLPGNIVTIHVGYKN